MTQVSVIGLGAMGSSLDHQALEVMPLPGSSGVKAVLSSPLRVVNPATVYQVACTQIPGVGSSNWAPISPMSSAICRMWAGSRI